MVQLATLLLRKVMKIESGVSVGTQPLSIIMEEKMREAVLSRAIDSILQGDCPILIGHPESWCNPVHIPVSCKS